MSEAQNQVENVDPRIRRTRKMLHEGLAKLLPVKDFDRISVQDIVDAADLHRATFYDHYPDKYALLECLVADRFHELLEKRGVRLDSCEGAMKSLALGVCDFMVSAPGASCGEHGRFQIHMQPAILAVVQRIVLEGLRHHPPVEETSADLIASTVSWAIYGAAKQWTKAPERCPAEQMAEIIERLVLPIFESA